PLEAFGVGTEQIESALRTCYPLAQVGRLDRDAAQRPAAQRRILDAWREGTTDILDGTQMGSKGPALPGASVVGRLLAALSLHIADPRAGGRPVARVVQAAGGGGRGARAGEALVQTFRPEPPAGSAAARHDYEGFMRAELERRRILGYPPFGRLVNVRL